ncbi:hypothetical protein [Peribacillus kribbensis]|uniref:hypothetical protein n=1 Tax=Peribacillus kribbensis TaxID=356658 RepID=UPI0004242EB2|nr:hypothetical protein [Peribacillus kribbensis]
MTKFIIAPVFQFVNFHLCKKLLDAGHEVIGMDDTPEREGSLQEKYLEIGRNGNFSFQNLEDWQEVWPAEGKTEFILSYYDVYKGPIEERDARLEVLKAIQQERSLQQSAIILAPVEIGEDLICNKDRNNADRIILLPTIYGPWQPGTMAFQSVLEGETKKIDAIMSEEYKKDALYVDDLMSCFPNMLSVSEKRLLVKSRNGGGNHWEECARELIEPIRISAEKDDEHGLSSFTPFLVQVQTSPKEGLKKQLDHFKRRQRLMNWP